MSMEENLLVSVIIPLYNGSRFIAETLDTALAQDYAPLEIIVIDDGSTDGGAEIVKNHSGPIRCICQENQGNAAARNHGIQKAKGEFIALLDQDDLWEKHKIKTHVDYMARHPELDYTIAHFTYFLIPGVERPAWLRESLVKGHQADYSPSSMVARKRAFEKVGNFKRELKIGSDSDWFFRARDMNVPMAVINEVLLHRRVHQANQSAHVRQAHVEMLKLIRASIHRKKINKTEC